MTAEALLSRLEGVRQTGSGRSIAKCPAHKDRSPSLSITEKSDGTVLINCFAGCSAAEVLGSVGLEFSDLFPVRSDWESTGKGPRRERSAFSPLDVLLLIEREALVVANLAAEVGRGMSLTDGMRARLWYAAGRISHGIEQTRASREVRYAR